MQTQIAYHEYLVTAQQNASFQNTLLWIFFIFVVIAPVLLAIIYCVVAILTQPKCPNCGSITRKKIYLKRKNTSTFVLVQICNRCKTPVQN